MDTRESKQLTIAVLWLLFPGFFLSAPASAEPVCAEIRQELTLERQAFDANLKITNDLDSIDLENAIAINFKDADGNPVSPETEQTQDS